MRPASIEEYQARVARIEGSPLPSSMAALLEAATQAAPDATLWDFFEDGRRASYREVSAAVARAAQALAAWGVRRGSHVGVMLPNVPELPVCWLALARLGAVMVPINLRYSQRELRYVVDDGEIEFLLIDASVAALAETGDQPEILPRARIKVLGEYPGAARWEAALAEAFDRMPEAAAVGPDDLVNIQYTSGTTGFPKGCLLSQRYWLTIGKVAAFRDERNDLKRILASTPFTYMDPQWLLMMTLYQRGTLYVARRQSASRFVSWLKGYRINFCLFPEAVLKQPPSPIDADNEVVRANVYGLRASAHAELERRFGLRAREAFGMTETGSALSVPLEAAEMVGSGSCGLPSPYRRTRIVDESGRDVPEGEIGELIVTGPGILQGYYRKPDATRAAFFGEWFRTGDLFRRDAQGYHYIVGRLKDMVRRSGENIAAREVEAVLRDLPDIADAAILPVPDPDRGEEVKAYLQLMPGTAADAATIERVLAYCRQQLAPFKVPRYLAFIDTMPRTTSNKIAKGTLAAASPDLRLGAYDRVDGLWR